ncbi:HNH endonuclease [Methylibium petroleiphilum]
MATMTYRQQLLDPRWQKKRLERLNDANWECENCGDKTTTLHVHHRQYFKGRMAWEYEGLELAVLCDPCHTAEHSDLDTLKGLLVSLNTAQVVGLLGGFNKACDWIDPAEIDQAREVDCLAFAAGFVAYVTHGLSIDDMLKVGAYAASLHREGSGYRLEFEHQRGNTFGERG